MADLFGTSDEKQDSGSSAARPLADRLRPANLDEVVGQEHLDVGQVGGSGGAVGEGDPVEQERGGERAHHEVLDAGLLGGLAAHVHRGEHVDRYREDLQSQEQNDEVVRRGHDDASRCRQEHQHVPLRTHHVLATQVALEQERPEQHRGRDDTGGEQREAVQSDGSGHHGGRPLVLDPVPQGDRRGDRPRGHHDGPGRVEPRRQCAANQRHDGQQQDATEDEDQGRGDRRPHDLGSGQGRRRLRGQLRKHGHRIGSLEVHQ